MEFTRRGGQHGMAATPLGRFQRWHGDDAGIQLNSVKERGSNGSYALNPQFFPCSLITDHPSCFLIAALSARPAILLPSHQKKLWINVAPR